MDSGGFGVVPNMFPAVTLPGADHPAAEAASPAAVGAP